MATTKAKKKVLKYPKKPKISISKIKTEAQAQAAEKKLGDYEKKCANVDKINKERENSLKKVDTKRKKLSSRLSGIKR